MSEMSSFSSRERKFECIRSAANESGFPPIYFEELDRLNFSGIAGPLGEAHHENGGNDMRAGIQRSRSPSSVSSLSLVEPLLICCVGGMIPGNGQHRHTRFAHNEMRGGSPTSSDDAERSPGHVSNECLLRDGASDKRVVPRLSVEPSPIQWAAVAVGVSVCPLGMFCDTANDDGIELQNMGDLDGGESRSVSHGGADDEVSDEDASQEAEPFPGEQINNGIEAGQQIENADAPDEIPGRHEHEGDFRLVMEDGAVVPVMLIPEGNSGPSKLLQRMYDSMGWSGVSWYIPGEDISKLTWSWWCFRIFIKVSFMVDTLMSLLDSFGQGKYGYYHAMSEERAYSDFVDLAVGLITFCLKAYCAYTLSCHNGKVQCMMNRINSYEEEYVTDPEIQRYSGKWKLHLVTLLTIATSICAVTRPFYATNEQNMRDLLLESSQELAEDTFIWSGEDIKGQRHQMFLQYGNVTTGTTIVMGSFVLSRDMASRWQIGMILLLVLTACVVAYILSMDFISDVNMVLENIPRNRVMEWTQLQARRERVWRKYRRLKLVFNSINVVFDPILKLLHVGNLLMYAYFMTLKTFYKYPWLFYTLYAVDMVKSEAYYYVAGKIAEQNEIVETWLRNWGLHGGLITVDDEHMDVGVILQELDREPLGLGKGKFLIEPTLHYKFLGLVLSIFLSMADDQNKVRKED